LEFLSKIGHGASSLKKWSRECGAQVTAQKPEFACGREGFTVLQVRVLTFDGT